MSKISEKLAEKAISVDAWYAMARHKARTNGDDIFTVEFHVSRDDWFNLCQAHPRNVAVKLTWWETETEEAVRHEAEKANGKPAKGPYGQLWRNLWAAGFPNCPDVREILTRERLAEHSNDKEVLRCLFCVDSLTNVGPDEIIGKFDSPPVHAMVRQVQRRLQETA